MTLREIIISMGFKVDPSSEKTAETAIHRLKRAATGALGLIAIGFGVNQIIQLTDEFTNVNARISLINDGLKSQKELEKDILGIANETRQSYGATAGLITRLRLSAKDIFGSTSKAVDFAAVVNKALIVGGASTGEQEASLLQLSQALGSGRLQGDEFRSLGENAPVIMQAIAEGLGKSRGELKELSKQGALTADVIYTAIMKSQDKINDMFLKMPITFAQATVIMRNKFGAFLARINRQSEMLQKIGSVMVSVFSAALESLEAIIINAGGLEKLLKKILFIVTAIWITMNKQKILAIIGGFSKILRLVKDQLWYARFMTKEYGKQLLLQTKQAAMTAWSIAGWVALFLLVEDFVGFLQGKKSLFGEALKTMGIEAEGVRKAFKGLSDMVGRVFEWLGDNAGLVMTIAEALLFLAGAAKIVSVAMGILNVVMNANPILLIITLIGSLILYFIHLWKTSEKFRNFWIGLWDGICKGFQATVNWLKSAFNTVKNFIIDNAGDILSAVFPILAIPNMLMKNWGKIKGFFSDKNKAFLDGTPTLDTLKAGMNGNGRTLIVNQDIKIDQEYNGTDREQQRKAAKDMGKNAEDVWAAGARTLSYGR